MAAVKVDALAVAEAAADALAVAVAAVAVMAAVETMTAVAHATTAAAKDQNAPVQISLVVRTTSCNAQMPDAAAVQKL